MASSNKQVPSGKVYLQVVGTDSVDTSPSILVFTDSQRYLFNCGEGTQRLFNENKLKFSKLNNIFFTQISWEYIGGLPGLAMTLRDNGRAKLGLYGPENIKDFIRATRFFLFHEKLHFDCVGYDGDDGDDEDVYRDGSMMIRPVLLSGETKNLTRKLEQQEENSPKRVKLDSCTTKSIACYICKLTTLPGKFLVQKAKELGVPSGPLFGKLKDGNDVILENGVKVLAEQVKEPDQEGPVFFIISCPLSKYISSLVESQQFLQYQERDKSKVQPCLIIHLVPMDVFYDCRYEKWRQGFGSTTQHLLINKEACCKSIVFQSQARIQVKLHTIDARIFPLLHFSDTPTIDPRTLPVNTKPGEFFLKFHIRPVKQQGYDRSGMQNPLDFNTIMKETTELLKSTTKTEQHQVTEEHSAQKDFTDNASQSEFEKTLQENSRDHSEDIVKDVTDIPLDETTSMTEVSSPFGKRGNDVTACGSGKQKHFEVIFLGTGASLPSKYRNVSATLINISCQSSLLLDCGEGTLGQLYRHYGNDMDDVISRLKCVFISHIHADHHLGLPRILLYKQQHKINDNDNEIIVIGPVKINLWLQEYSMNCEELHYRFIDCGHIDEADHELSQEFRCIEAKQVLAVAVDHCAQAYGLVLQHTSGWKLVYSGDTRPCPALIQAGSDATMLIHEATFEDVLQDEAIDKKHSTTTEAITSGIKMNASFTMLNHFSQRYPKIPVFNEKFTKHTGIAFDHMKVNQASVFNIPRLVGPLNVLFAEEVEDMTKRTKTTAPGDNTTVMVEDKKSAS